MIVGFRDDWLGAFYFDDLRSTRIPPDLQSRLYRRLQMIDVAMTEQDLRVPPGNRFEKLRGNLDGYCSVRVNQQWRVIFHWDETCGEASDIYLDNHSYR